MILEGTSKKMRDDSPKDKIFVRPESRCTDLSRRFKHQSRDFTKQFAHIYAVRLTKMRDIILNRIHLKWGDTIPVKRLIDLEEDNGNCVVIGTLFKHQELKPSILKEISDEHQLAPQPLRKNFVDENDQLILEDEQQRIRLIGDIDVHRVVTGVVCGVLGHNTGDGKFIVEDCCWPYVPLRVTEPSITQENRLLILVSGLALANNANSLLPLQLLVDWVGGLLGDPKDQKLQAQAVRIIVAGNSVRNCATHKVSTLSNLFKIDIEDSVKAVKQLDDFLLQLVRSIEVDLMPGEYDPANHLMPQQPLHYCMFPRARVYESLHGVTNPYECELDGHRILGTSGQPIQDIASFSKLSDPLEILERTLEWAHLAPSCPDTLSGYPFYKEDPFIITECPDLYFAGNQDKFQTKVYEGPDGQKTRLVCVPSFVKTHTCVVVELNTMDCYPVSFGAGDVAGTDMDVDQ